MARQPNPEGGILWRAVLVMSILTEAHVLYSMEHAGARLGMGILLVIPIVWSALRIKGEEVRPAVAGERPVRRYNGLRNQVSLFLGEVQRLNWLAVDFQRGTTDRTRIQREMDAIERRLDGLVRRIREEAGHTGEA